MKMPVSSIAAIMGIPHRMFPLIQTIMSVILYLLVFLSVLPALFLRLFMYPGFVFSVQTEIFRHERYTGHCFFCTPILVPVGSKGCAFFKFTGLQAALRVCSFQCAQCV